MTKYVVLRKSSSGWLLESDEPGIEASSPASAIRKHVLTGMKAEEAADETSHHEAESNYGVFVAVPARSWKPEPVALDVQIRLKIG
jgi:hypothetical protein